MDPKSPVGLDQDVFIEDADATFQWKNIPLEGWICLPLFWVLAAVVFWQFFTRYALANSAVWTEEAARQLLILLTFFGAGYAARTRAHISINYFVLKLRPGGRRVAQDLIALFQCAFFAYGFYLCIKIAQATKYQTLMSIDMSKSLVYYAVAVGFAIMTLRAVADVYAIARGYLRSSSGDGRAAAGSADNPGGES